MPTVSNVQDTNNWCSFKCKFCSQAFEDRKSWKYHTMDEHGILPYACRYCDERYDNKSDLKDHQHFHKSRHKGIVPSQQSEMSSPHEVVTNAEDDASKGDPCDVASEKSVQNHDKPCKTSDEVSHHMKEDTTTTSSIDGGKTVIMRKKKTGCKTKANILRQQNKKTVVVVSVLDVLKSDAEKMMQQQQQQKGGASGALLSIVDQIRTSTGQSEVDKEQGEALDILKGNYRLRGAKKSLPAIEDDDDVDGETDGEQEPGDDSDELYDESKFASQTSTPRHKHKKQKNKKHSKGSKIHKCKICPRVLSSNKVKVYHERGHPYPIECKFCHWTFQNKFDCDDHEIGHVTGSWTCRLCSEVFEDSHSFDRHRKVHHQQEKDSQHFSCQYCSKVMKSKKSLEVHLRVHTGEKPYKCSFCDKSYRHYESWNYHESKHKGTLKQHVCQFCGKAFGGKYGLQVHERIHTGEKPFKCDHCNLAFSSNEKLKVHKDRVRGLAFVCQFCGKEFFTRANLNQHEMIHKGVKPHKCKSCEASFTSVTSLKYHVRTAHTGERYPCQICNKQCKSKGQLTSHLRSHTDERPFKCKYCNKSFRNSNTLKTHEQGIHMGYRYTCEICKKDFSQRTALRTHDKLVHQGIKWKDMVLQRKLNREKRLAQDGTKQEGATALDVKFELTSPQIPTTEHNMLEPQSGHEAVMHDAGKHINKQPVKLYQPRMMYPVHLEQQPDHSHQTDPGMDTHMSSRPSSHPNLTIPTSLPPIPVSVSVSTDPNCVDVAYQLATLASNARHLLHMRQGHPDEGALQVHVPGVAPSDSGVVDVVFPSDSAGIMYQTL
ncbi:uncharacterized protein [Amphiura filiformis]|uniref:uncharacterized protein n=1 Tax=Amphiura filiformis TaxID=82378 RepID=UPI003B221323